MLYAGKDQGGMSGLLVPSGTTGRRNKREGFSRLIKIIRILA